MDDEKIREMKKLNLLCNNLFDDDDDDDDQDNE